MRPTGAPCKLYTPHTARDIEEMLDAVGAKSLEELTRVPDEVALKSELEVVPALPESAILRRFESFAARNEASECISFLGAGAYRHYCPPAVMALAMRGEFLTSYTPYQAEVSQGYLQAIYEWQTYIALLTGLNVANASVYDGATALAEGVIMAIHANGRKKVLVSRAVHPNYRAVLKTYADGLDLTVDELPLSLHGTSDWSDLGTAAACADYAAIVVQSPNFFGNIESPPAAASSAIAESGAVLIAVVAEALSLAALRTPASWGAQIAVGDAQSFGVPVAYGGPYVGFIAAAKEHLRRIPGRLVGKTLDNRGQEAYVLTLQAREQHIRRERATSNICTNQAHCALIATMYLALLGQAGLRDCAAENLRRSRELATRVSSVPGCALCFDAPFFNEFVLKLPVAAKGLLQQLAGMGILAGVDLGRWYPEYSNSILMTATELTTSEDIDALCAALGKALRVATSV